jgi:hypothetical protein
MVVFDVLVSVSGPFEKRIDPTLWSLPASREGLSLPFSLPLLAGEGPGIGVQKTSQMAS